MKTTREHVLSEIKETLHRVAPEAKAVLFGSFGWGDGDWDILILVDKDKIRNDDFDMIVYPLFELGWNIGEMIHPMLYTFSDWEKRSFTIFHKTVEEEGIAL